MSNYEHLTEFFGKPVIDWEPGTALTDPANTAYRLSISWDEYEEEAQWIDKFAQFLAEPSVEQVTALIIGPWDGVADMSKSSEPVVEALVSARDRLTHLEALFLGEITSEESEISWIEQSDVSALFEAYPQLSHFQVRGGNQLALGAPVHAHLRTLIVEAGALDTAVVQSVCAARLPSLEHLELWLGTARYGGNVTLEDIQPLLDGKLFPQLSYLGLRDADIVDQIAEVIADVPILDQIKVLDLSLGILTDAGGEALLASPKIKQLTKLDLHHHFLSTEVMEKFGALGIEVNTDEQQTADVYDGETYRYVAVGE